MYLENRAVVSGGTAELWTKKAEIKGAGQQWGDYGRNHFPFNRLRDMLRGEKMDETA